MGDLTHTLARLVASCFCDPHSPDFLVRASPTTLCSDFPPASEAARAVRAPDQTPLVGRKCRRGVDWDWGSQDGKPGTIGTIEETDNNGGCVARAKGSRPFLFLSCFFRQQGRAGVASA